MFITLVDDGIDTNMWCSMSKPGFCRWNELLSYDVFEKECSFHMIYYLCVYALSVQSYAPQNKL